VGPVQSEKFKVQNCQDHNPWPQSTASTYNLPDVTKTPFVGRVIDPTTRATRLASCGETGFGKQDQRMHD